MFKTASKEKIGKHLKHLIDSKGYPSNRQFGIDFLKKRDGIKHPTEDQILNISNKICQILKGAKSVQLEDLPALCELLDVSMEEIISGGEFSSPSLTRVTNYSIALSNNPKEWELYINREDKLFLNPDEYNKTIIDYALEANNYKFLKFLLDKKYIWFTSDNSDYYGIGFGAGTSIKRRDLGSIDNLDIRLKESDDLRYKMAVLCIENGDTKTLESLHIREIPELYFLTLVSHHTDIITKGLPTSNNLELLIKSISKSRNSIINYFFEEYIIHPHYSPVDGTYIFPYANQLLKELIKTNPSNAIVMLEKSIKHNKSIRKKLENSIFRIMNEYAEVQEWKNPNSPELQKQLRIEYEKYAWSNYYFYPKSGFIVFLEHPLLKNKDINGIISNIINVNAKSSDKSIQFLINELNDSFNFFNRLKKNNNL